MRIHHIPDSMFCKKVECYCVSICCVSFDHTAAGCITLSQVQSSSAGGWSSVDVDAVAVAEADAVAEAWSVWAADSALAPWPDASGHLPWQQAANKSKANKSHCQEYLDQFWECIHPPFPWEPALSITQARNPGWVWIGPDILSLSSSPDHF